MRSKILTIITGGIAGPFRRGILLAALLIVAACQTSPPVQEMSDARQAIAVAREAGAEERAAEDLREAEAYLESAEKKLAERAYAQARSDALQAKQKALTALSVSEQTDDGR